jgi:hypothetical protein
VSVRANLHVSKLILRVLKLTIMQVSSSLKIYEIQTSNKANSKSDLLSYTIEISQHSF